MSEMSRGCVVSVPSQERKGSPEEYEHSTTLTSVCVSLWIGLLNNHHGCCFYFNMCGVFPPQVLYFLLARVMIFAHIFCCDGSCVFFLPLVLFILPRVLFL